MKWTEEDEQRLREGYATGTPIAAIAKLLGRSRASVDGKAAHMGIRDLANRQDAYNRQEAKAQYRKGANRRQMGRTKCPPALLTPAERSWWLAGWHDRDMEMGVSVLEGNAA